MDKLKQIQCLGFIMDGNRRWAKDQGVPTYEGHKKGSEVMSDMVKWIRDATIPHAVFYAFSTENWNRTEEEVAYLMDLFRQYLHDIKEKLDSEDKEVQNEQPVIVRVVGRRGDFPQDIQDQMTELEERNKSRKMWNCYLEHPRFFPYRSQVRGFDGLVQGGVPSKWIPAATLLNQIHVTFKLSS